jgi:hypothetical protein
VSEFLSRAVTAPPVFVGNARRGATGIIRAFV